MNSRRKFGRNLRIKEKHPRTPSASITVRPISIITRYRENSMRMLSFSILKFRRKSRENIMSNIKSIWNIKKDLRNNIESTLSSSKSSMRNIRGSSLCRLILINLSMFRTHSQFQFITKSRIEYMRKKFPPMMRKSVITQCLTLLIQQQAKWSLTMHLLYQSQKIKPHQVLQISKLWYQRTSICLTLR